VRALLSYHPEEQISVRDRKNRTCLHFAAGLSNDYQDCSRSDEIRRDIIKHIIGNCNEGVMRTLIECRSSGNGGQTSLHEAAWHNMPKAHQILVGELGVQAPSLLNIQGEDWWSKLDICAHMGEHPESNRFQDGMVVAIRNASSNKFLRGGDGISMCTRANNDISDDFKWKLKSLPERRFAISSLSSGLFLLGGSRRDEGQELRLSDRGRVPDTCRTLFLKWGIEEVEGEKYAIKSASSSSYIYEDDAARASLMIGVNPLDPNPPADRLQWNIIEVDSANGGANQASTAPTPSFVSGAGNQSSSNL